MGVQTLIPPGNRSASTKGESGATAAAAPRVPFRSNTQEHAEFGYAETRQLGAATVPITPKDIPSGGYLRGVPLLVSAPTAGNAAAVAFQADGPWSILDNISLQEVNGAFLVGPITGYELYLINLLGGYQFESDAATRKLYLATTGAGATGGTIKFMIRIPVEAISREAIGALGNGAANATLKVKHDVAPSGTVYSTAPTTLPAVTITAYPETWTQPPETNLFGASVEPTPPAHGTVSRWSKAIFPVKNGANRQQLSEMGNVLREAIFIFRTAAGARSDTLVSGEVSLEFETHPVERLPYELWQDRMQERYGFTTAQVPTGVIVKNWNHDMDGHPGGELRDLWFPTAQQSRFEVVFNASADGTLTVLTNSIVPTEAGAPVILR